MKKILVPTDFSKAAENAAQYAVQLALHLHCDIILFHASGILSDEDDRKLRETALLLKAGNPGIHFEHVSTAKLFNSQTLEDLFGAETLAFIVMGTMGSDAPLTHKIFGTNAAEVVEQVQCPVLVIPHTCTYDAITKIAYASDNRFLDHELPHVLAFAKEFKSQVHILHLEEKDEKNPNDTAKNLHNLLSTTSQSDYDLSVTYTSEKAENGGNILDAIEDFVTEKNCDLLVLFHENFSGLRRFFHTGISEKATAKLKLPILVFQKKLS